jgi:hypothetical protein
VVVRTWCLDDDYFIRSVVVVFCGGVGLADVERGGVLESVEGVCIA